MDVDAFADQHHADQHDEGQCQHADGRVVVDEVADRIRGEDHHHDREDDRGDHDRNAAHHADRGDDRVERKHDVDDRDLDDDEHEFRGRRVLLRLARLGEDRVADLHRALDQQEHAAADHDQVAQRDDLAERGEQAQVGVVQARHLREDEEQRAARDAGQGQAEAACTRAHFGRQAADRDRDEHEVVGAEHDFQRAQGQQRNQQLAVKHHVAPSLGNCGSTSKSLPEHEAPA